MKHITFLLILLSTPFLLLCQTSNGQQTDSSLSYEQIQRSIYRISLIQPLKPEYEGSAILAASNERKIQNVLSLTIKAGLCVSVHKFGSSNNRNQTSFHIFSAAEMKYFPTLKRRLKKGKSIINYSGPYISLEQNLFTNPVALINQIPKEALKGNTGTFANLGYQKQFGNLYLAAFFGGRIWGHNFSKYDDGSLNSIHGGIMVGYVF